MTALLGTGFFANVASGAISGVFAGQYDRLASLVLAGQINQIGITLFRPQDLVLDATLGGIGGAVGYGLGSITKGSTIINNRGEPYPDIDVPNYGKVPFPKEAMYITPNLREPRSSTYRNNYIDAWEISSKPVPTGGWANYKIHHIQPIEYGGTNDISNLVHLPQPIHDLFTQWWAGGYGPR
jgi:hypothetical protein